MHSSRPAHTNPHGIALLKVQSCPCQGSPEGAVVSHHPSLVDNSSQSMLMFNKVQQQNTSYRNIWEIVY